MKKNKYIFTYNMNFMNIFATILFVIIFIITFFINKNIFITYLNSSVKYCVLLLILMIFYFILHECIHGLFYLLNGAKWQNIRFGIALEKGILYCKSCEKINKRNILMSVIAPFILIGLVTYIIGLIINNAALVFLSMLNISGCAGDLIVFFFFLKRNKDLLFKEIGDTTTFFIETKEDLKNKKFIGLKLDKEIEDENILKDDLNKKINISKFSAITLIILLIIFIVCLLFF